jgi:AraC family transcriptional regulator, 4-hydroxyphenylacetate 3-monooxygenase operon regulatory protein
MHSYYELHYVTGGQGELILNERSVPLSRGCAYLIPPRVYHEQRTDPGDLLKEYHFAFTLTAAGSEDLAVRRLFSETLCLADASETEALFDAVFTEVEAMRYGYREMALRYVQSVFILLMRAVSKPERALAPSATHPDDGRVITTDEAFIYEYGTVTLSALSSRLKLSPRQTQRFIREKYGALFSVLKNTRQAQPCRDAPVYHRSARGGNLLSRRIPERLLFQLIVQVLLLHDAVRLPEKP